MKELMKKLGKMAVFITDGMSFDVEITNVRKAFGRIDYEIKPMSGSGSKWVSSDRIREDN